MLDRALTNAWQLHPSDNVDHSPPPDAAVKDDVARGSGYDFTDDGSFLPLG